MGASGDCACERGDMCEKQCGDWDGRERDDVLTGCSLGVSFGSRACDQAVKRPVEICAMGWWPAL